MSLKDRIDTEIKSWNRRSQKVWEQRIPDLINSIESWLYRSFQKTILIDDVDLSAFSFKCDNLMEFIIHCKLCIDSNLDYDVILDYTWHIVDGRHRLVKAILEWKKTIKATQLLEKIYPLNE